jgi:hypothetical protein
MVRSGRLGAPAGLQLRQPCVSLCSRHMLSGRLVCDQGVLPQLLALLLPLHILLEAPGALAVRGAPTHLRKALQTQFDFPIQF